VEGGLGDLKLGFHRTYHRWRAVEEGARIDVDLSWRCYEYCNLCTVEGAIDEVQHELECWIDGEFAVQDGNVL